MKVHVELQAYLDQYSPLDDGQFDYEIAEGARVKDLIKKLGVPEDIAAIVVVNGSNADPSYELQESDRVTLIPPLAGG